MGVYRNFIVTERFFACKRTASGVDERGRGRRVAGPVLRAVGVKAFKYILRGNRPGKFPGFV